jgi:hypothetical protein
VCDNGLWYSGLLRAWRREDGGWLAFVNMTKRPGETYVGWVDAEHVRLVEE